MLPIEGKINARDSIIMTDIIEITDFKVINNLLPNIDKDTLVIFDVDEVLIMPTDEYRLTHPFRRELVKDIQSRLSLEEQKILFSIIMLKQTMRLVDMEIIDLLNKLKEYKIPTIALTKFLTGKIGNISKVEDLLFKNLALLNISFQDLTPFKNEIKLHGMHGNSGIPFLKDGVIMTAMIDKAKVLKSVFTRMSYFPRKIIFIDDKLDNLQSVQNFSINSQIIFQGFHYLGANNIPERLLDLEVEKRRFSILERSHQWLNDNEI